MLREPTAEGLERFEIREQPHCCEVWLRVQTGSTLADSQQWVVDQLEGVEWETHLDGRFHGVRPDPGGS
jgi:hypothetical protein